MKKRAKPVFAAQEIAVFCEQVSLILGSNIPLHEGIEALKEDYLGAPGEAAYLAMAEEMNASGSLAAAVEAAGVFPVYMTGMVRVGEEAGTLDTVMRGLAQHYAREAQLRESAVSAVRYPLTLLAVMTLVITVLVCQVMPIFEKAFMSLSGGMGGASAAMLRAGQAAGVFVFAFLLLVLGAAAALWLLTRGGRRPELTQRLLRMAAPLGRLNRLVHAQRFASVLSMLLGGGFPLEQALEMMPAVFDGEAEKALMREAADRMLSGMPISSVVEETGLFDLLHLRMIRVGFASGQADEALARVADLQAQEIDTQVGRMIALIEPVLVIVLGAMIGAILLSVMMPLAGVLSAMA